MHIAMQRKILAVEKCVCYGGKISFKGESIQIEKQILEVSGELRTLKLQLIKLFFAFWEATTNENNSFLSPQDSVGWSCSCASCEHV